jgi:hypothetical protein
MSRLFKVLLIVLLLWVGLQYKRQAKVQEALFAMTVDRDCNLQCDVLGWTHYWADIYAEEHAERCKVWMQPPE